MCDNTHMEQLLQAAYGELGAAITQSLPTDDQIIMNHVRSAHAILKSILENMRKVR